ncbi:MAG: potassium channel protein [Syntrophobacteraceae bacterium]|nr:potassium channel protein [Syntrophobacteraceae bacterium]
MKGFWNSAIGQRTSVIAAISIALLAFGVAGYMLLEHFTFLEALYMTVITLSTVGFTEVRPLDSIGRIFTMVLILMGAGFIAFSLAYFSQIVLDGDVLEAYRRRKLTKKLAQMENHYIICGCGQMGQIIADRLLEHKVSVVIVESDESVLVRLREKGLVFLNGDATDEENLVTAGIDRAKGLVAVVSKDSENVFIVLTARDLNKKLHIFARAGSPGTDKRLLKAGADRVVSPYVIGAAKIAHNILRPTVTDFLDLALSGEGMHLSLEEMRLPEESRLIGMELRASGIRDNFNLIIVAIKRADGTMVFNPAPGEKFQPSDTLVAIGSVENLSRFGRDCTNCYATLRPGSE